MSKGISFLGAREALTVIGGVFVILGIVWLSYRIPDTASIVGEFVIFLLITFPGLVLLHGAYRLPQYDVRPEFHHRIVTLILGGVGSMIAVLVIFHFRPGGELRNPAQSTLILTALGSVAGFGMGVYDAKAKTHAQEIEIHNRELRQSQAQLEQLVGRLRDKNEQIEEFITILSHDLRNPLNVARGRLELAREANDNEHLREVANAHERMETMIDDLLSRAQTDSQGTNLETVALHEIAENAWKNVVTFQASLEMETEQAVKADPILLLQLLENLIRNAVEHGGQDVTISLGVLSEGFYVEDDGPGIPEEKRETVLESGYSSSTEGFGLGLSIVKRIAETHDWTITVTTGNTGGARFEITNVELQE